MALLTTHDPRWLPLVTLWVVPVVAASILVRFDAECRLRRARLWRISVVAAAYYAASLALIGTLMWLLNWLFDHAMG